MQLITVKIEKPDDTNFILGQHPAEISEAVEFFSPAIERPGINVGGQYEGSHRHRGTILVALRTSDQNRQRIASIDPTGQRTPVRDLFRNRLISVHKLFD